MLLPDKPPKGADQKLEGGGGGMGDFRKNILKTDFGGKFLQGNTRPSEKKILHRFVLGKKLFLPKPNHPSPIPPSKVKWATPKLSQFK